MNYKNLWPTLRKTFSAWNDHNARRLGAALVFYSILSLAPLVILILAIVAFVFGHSNAPDQIIGQVEGMIGKEGGDAVRSVIEHAQKPSSNTIASILGVVTLGLGRDQEDAAIRRKSELPPRAS
jgi:membrane protein